MKLTNAILSLALLFTSIACAAPATKDTQQMPAHSPSLEQHAWLRQFVGEWESEALMPAAHGEAPQKLKGHESVRALGGLWIVADVRGESPLGAMEAMLTIGYDESKKRFVGTWIDSMMNHLWHYEGTLDATGKVLSLESEGPSFSGDGTTARYKDVYELKSREQKTLTSFVQSPDGTWTSFMSAEYRRVK